MENVKRFPKEDPIVKDQKPKTILFSFEWLTSFSNNYVALNCI